MSPPDYPVFRVLNRDQLKPNTWNPNRQDSFIYEKELASIREFGFVAPIIVKPDEKSGFFLIVDGEHRWKAAKELGIFTVPCYDIGPVDDDIAKQLTIVLNETKGRTQPDLLRTLLTDLSARHTPAELLRVLPYTPQQFTATLEGFSWDAAQAAAKPKPQEEERWTLLSWRVPVATAEVIRDAIEAVQREGKCPDWEALESICADYLAGTR